MSHSIRLIAPVLLLAAAAACAKRPPVAPPVPPPDLTATAKKEEAPPPPAPKPLPPTTIEDKPITPAITADSVLDRSIDEWNRDSPLKPVFFALDSSELDDQGRAIGTANADVMRKYPSLMITIEGHADERGTPEYNLALGERRALAVKTYLVSLGISADRLRTVSYGEEFPFAAEHDESAYSKNRRAHFVITAK